MFPFWLFHLFSWVWVMWPKTTKKCYFSTTYWRKKSIKTEYECRHAFTDQTWLDWLCNLVIFLNFQQTQLSRHTCFDTGSTVIYSIVCVTALLFSLYPLLWQECSKPMKIFDNFFFSWRLNKGVSHMTFQWHFLVYIYPRTKQRPNGNEWKKNVNMLLL